MRILTHGEKKTAGWLLLCDTIVSIMDIAFLALLLVIIKFSGRYPLWLLAAFFLLFSCKNLAGFLVYRAQCRHLFRVASRISRDKLTSYLEGGYAGFINTDSSVHIREISYEPLEFCQHVLGGFLQMVTQAALILLAIGGIVFYNAKLFFLLLLILLPPVIALSWLLKGRLHSIRQNAQHSSERSLQHLREALAGYVESNIYDRNETFLHKFLHYQRQYNSYLSGQMILQGAPARLIEIFALLGVVILIMVHQWSGTGGDTAVITIGVFMAAAYKIIPGIVKILNLSGQINTYGFTLTRLTSPVQKPSLQEQQTVPDHIRSIQMKGIDFSYNGHPVLRGLDLCMEPGDFLGIEGPSGNGKTTILNVLLGFLTPAKGKVIINGTETIGRDYWSRIAYVKQRSFLIHDSIRNNITLDGQRCDEEKLKNAVHAAQLDDLIGSLPGKIDTIIAEDGRNISGGQRQRIALARALYKETDLIILDEPFNELDEDAETSLLLHFRRLAQAGKMIILITHNRKSLSFCNKTLSLHEETV